MSKVGFDRLLASQAGFLTMKSAKTNFPLRARGHAQRGDNADLLALADAVRTARAGAGLTQAQLALVSGVGRDTVIALENARPGVSLGHALRVMKGLGLTIAPTTVKR
jgi:DNA-binding XRE family transcriptional regulator